MLAKLITYFFKSKPIDMALYGKVIDAIAVSGSLQTELKAKVEQAMSEPKLFYDDKGYFNLSERGLSYPKDAAKTAKFVLIDTLIQSGQVAEVDWKEEEAEVRFAINQILQAKHYDLVISQDTIFVQDGDTLDMITDINDEELAPAGYSLQLINIDSDSYVFTIVLNSQVEEVKRLLIDFG